MLLPMRRTRTSSRRAAFGCFTDDKKRAAISRPPPLNLAALKGRATRLEGPPYSVISGVFGTSASSGSTKYSMSRSSSSSSSVG